MTSNPLLIFAALAALSGCGERDPTSVDGGSDAGFVDTGAENDAGTEDSGGRDAVVVDGSLAGTSLEGIVIEWTDDLVLCEHWLENGTIDDAAAEKVEVHLPRQIRTTLDPVALSNATLRVGRVARSPFASDQWWIEGSTSVVTRWELNGPADSAHLSAEIEHQLGTAGSLIERFGVQRSAGDRSPLHFGAEHSFWYRPSNDEPFLLVPCDAPAADLETAVVVMSAFDGSAWVTVLREQRMQVALEGSVAVYPTRSEANFPDGLIAPFGAHGHWPHLYTAGHHNRYEQARIRFDQDLIWNYRVFGPLARGEVPADPLMPKTIDFADLAAGATGTVAVTFVDPPTGSESERTYQVEVDWTRVDTVELARSLAGCPSPEIKALWSGSALGTFLFQLGFCRAEDSIEDLALLVPVYFELNPRVVGTRLGPAMMSPTTVDGFPGVAIDLGSHRIEIGDSGNSYSLVIRDQTGTELDSPFAFVTSELFTTWTPSGREPIVAASADGTVTASVVRETIGLGGGNSTLYAPISFSLAFGNERHEVVAWDRLVYSNTHHNFDDSLVGEDLELRISWRIVNFAGRSFEVGAVRLSDGAEVLPPTRVEAR